jgi:metallo-beta-lactamase class B
VDVAFLRETALRGSCFRRQHQRGIDVGLSLLADKTHGDLVPRMRQSIAMLAALPCDILVPVHPDSIGLDRKLARIASGEATSDSLVDTHACRDYAAQFTRVLDQRVAKEKAEAAAKH